jgi:hypothetical protein
MNISAPITGKVGLELVDPDMGNEP